MGKKLVKQLLKEGLNLESVLSEISGKLDFSSFKMNDNLQPDFWGEDEKLDKEIRAILIKIADDYWKELDLGFDYSDITMTGSLANYNWSKHSDVDLHILFDMNKLGESKEMIKDLLDFKTRKWNSDHDITIKDFEVELYLQPEGQEHHSTGVYSLLNNDWIVQPEKKVVNLDKANIRKKYSAIAKRIQDLESDAKSTHDHQQVIDKVDKLREKVRKMRQSGLESGGEFSVENIVFKMLRRNDFMEKLGNLSKDTYDDQHTIKEIEKFPVADPPMYGDSDYKSRNGIILQMKPQDYLSLVPHLEMDEESEENIDDLIDMMQQGVEIDPPTLYLDGPQVVNHDGRHRAHAGIKLGLSRIPVLMLDVNGKSPQLKGIKKQTK